MNTSQLRVKYPKSYKLLYDFVLNKMKGSGGISEDTLKILPVDVLIDTTVVLNPRSLYDLFDQHEIYFHVSPTVTGGPSQWYCSINDDEIDETIFYPSRSKAEDMGFTTCFALLEEKLN